MSAPPFHPHPLPGMLAVGAGGSAARGQERTGSHRRLVVVPPLGLAHPLLHRATAPPALASRYRQGRNTLSIPVHIQPARGQGSSLLGDQGRPGTSPRKATATASHGQGGERVLPCPVPPHHVVDAPVARTTDSPLPPVRPACSILRPGPTIRNASQEEGDLRTSFPSAPGPHPTLPEREERPASAAQRASAVAVGSLGEFEDIHYWDCEGTEEEVLPLEEGHESLDASPLPGTEELAMLSSLSSLPDAQSVQSRGHASPRRDGWRTASSLSSSGGESWEMV